MRYIKHENSQLTFAEIEKPNIKHDEVLIKVAAIGVNRADCLQRQDKYPPPKGDSEILGLECAGTVVAQGENVEVDWLNKPVFTLCAGGAYSEYVAVDAAQVMPLADSMSMAEGAAVSEVYLTAFSADRKSVV